MAEALLRAAGLRVAFGAREILHGVDFNVAEGESIALLGPNGSGKATCLHPLCGLAPVTCGAVRASDSAGRRIGCCSCPVRSPSTL